MRAPCAESPHRRARAGRPCVTGPRRRGGGEVGGRCQPPDTRRDTSALRCGRDQGHLRGVDDARLWATAREGGFVILTKDDDFNARSVLYGAPPKVACARDVEHLC
ncbi:MAG: DUF5615 family PIN-like protein [Acidobacteria bacterium]|nr:DUF5615 family PIN-like protein [Acidobacteriota bacterium]